MYNYLVAVSGGPDSMALLDLLRKYSLNLIVAHVNYNQRESALKDEMIVSDYCLKYNLKLFIKRFEGTYQGNFQNYARILRYDFFHELYHEYNCQALFLAHHNDDHLETFLIQKIQNRIPYTYGLNMISYYKDMKLIRPLLSLRKKELLAYCLSHGILFGHDESNDTNKYLRNYLRNKILSNFKEKELFNLNNLIAKINLKKKIKENNYEDLLSRKAIAYQFFLILDKEFYLHHKLKASISNKEIKELIKKLKAKDILITDYPLVIEKRNDKIYFHEKNQPFKIVINSLEELYNKTNSKFNLCKEGKLIERFSFDLDDFPLTFRSTLKEDQIKLRYGTKKINRFYIDRKYSYLEKGQMITILNKDHEVIFITNIGASVKFFDKAYKFYLCLNN